MGFSSVVSLIYLPGCSSIALFSVCVGSLVVLEFYLLVVTLLVGSLLQQVYWCSQLPAYLVCDQWQSGLRQRERILWDLKYEQVENS